MFLVVGRERSSWWWEERSKGEREREREREGNERKRKKGSHGSSRRWHLWVVKVCYFSNYFFQLCYFTIFLKCVKKKLFISYNIVNPTFFFINSTKPQVRKLQTRGSDHINNLNIPVSLFSYFFITPLCVFFFLAPKFTLLLFFWKKLNLGRSRLECQNN